jgi:hypothetical protein
VVEIFPGGAGLDLFDRSHLGVENEFVDDFLFCGKFAVDGEGAGDIGVVVTH